ncbi:MAG: tetratricopeptide repeat protein [Acidobacteria bacterium]|nr:tetratricopeptide repeat protein [Acidobacteriota bacterium]
MPAIPSSPCIRPSAKASAGALLPTLALASFLWLPAPLPGLTSNLEEADRSFLSGDYQRALLLYRESAEPAPPASLRARLGLLKTLLATGRYRSVEEQALRFLKDRSDSCELQLLLGEAYWRRGELRLARQSLQEARRYANCRNRAELKLARILEEQGHSPQSRRLLLELYSRIEAQDGKDLGLAAIALQQLRQYRESNRYFRRATQADPDDLDTQIAWGNLFLEKYDPANASTSFKAVLKINPNLPEALLGMALTLTRGSSEQAEALLTKALKVNPNLEPAQAALAEIAIDREDFEAAEKRIRLCLETNPRSLKALSLQAVLHYARGEEQALDDALQSLLELNPRYGNLYRHLARYCVTQRLYRQAVDFFRQAIRLNPNLFSAYADLGVNLLRIGRESEAKEILERAYQVDPFNLWTVNTLRLLDSFVNFETLTTPHFSLKLHREEAALLGHYVPPMLEKAYAALSARYGFSPAGPIYFEMYPNHEDFAVRALGVPGLGALGVCFGPGIVMDSPKARPRGQFNWASTLWHEFAHVITLGMTDHHVPRWFSEGISVMEEHRAMPGWGDRLNLQTLKFVQQGKLLPIRELNGGFLRPRFPGQVALAYFQAGMACEFIEARFGFSRILAMLESFGRKASLEDVLRQVLDLSPEEFDRRFQDYLESILGGALEHVDFQLLGQKELMNSPERLEALLAEQPHNFFANLKMAGYYRERGEEDAAIPLLSRAKSVFPAYAGPDSPYRQLSRIYRQRGRNEAAIDELRQLTDIHGADLESLTTLATWLEEEGRSQEAAAVLERAIQVYPFDRETHQELGDLFMGEGKAAMAVREYRALLALQPPDKAAAHYQLARALLRLGRRVEAKTEVLSSLEIAPGFEPAQELLLTLVE